MINFKLGVSSAPTQIEGGQVESNWSEFSKLGRISDSTSPSNANNHYNLYKEDALLMNSLSIKHYRMGVDWARCESECGVYDLKAIKHYYDEITYLNSLGIECLVTLHHFTNPLWFEKIGSFTKKKNIKYFLNFVRVIVNSFKDLKIEYITINEPNVYATQGYLFNIFPPGKKNIFKTLKVISLLASTHIEAYKIIKEISPTSKVSFANHIRLFQSLNNNPINKLLLKIADALFQKKLTLAASKGKFGLICRNHFHNKKGIYIDFHALNYYTRTILPKPKKNGFNPPINDLSWEIYPKGITESAQYLYDILPIDIYITENGTCDKNDSFRCRYIYEHILALNNSRLPIKKYYHWCFCDNFEWAEGESARFGIVNIDFTTQERKVKKSGYFYKDLIENGLTDEIFNKYVKDEEYNYLFKTK
jgi:beta-glucosidase